MYTVVYAGYCNSATAPTLANATVGTINTILGTTTTFTCNFGFQSTGGGTNPYFQCLVGGFGAGSGTWGPINYYCIGVQILSYYSCAVLNVSKQKIWRSKLVGIYSVFIPYAMNTYCLKSYSYNLLSYSP